MRALVLLALALAGCTVVSIKAYDGPERSDSELGILETEYRDDTFLSSDTAIAAIDDKKFDKRRYSARILPGPHSIGIDHMLRVSRQKRGQYCVFALSVEACCTYRPALPGYPRAALDGPADAQWKVDSFMTMAVECADMTYASRLPVQCASRAP